MELRFAFRCTAVVLLFVALGYAQTSSVATAPGPPKSQGTLTQVQIRDLIRRSADNDVQNDKKLRDYTYVERQQVDHLDRKGKVKSIE